VAKGRRTDPLHVIVQGKHLDVTPALREYAEEKVGRISRYFDQVQEAQVVLSVERRDGMGKAQIVEVTVWGDGLVLRGEEASQDMYASIDLVFDKLRKQIEKYRSKLIERRRISESRRKDRLAEAIRAEQRRPDIDPEAETSIVRTKRFAMKPMTADDAVMQLELLGHDFFVFRNSETMEVNVVYRRDDGKYGLIEPEA
jgi:putative sigma-54 modulation protein